MKNCFPVQYQDVRSDFFWKSSFSRTGRQSTIWTLLLNAIIVISHVLAKKEWIDMWSSTARQEISSVKNVERVIKQKWLSKITSFGTPVFLPSNATFATRSIWPEVVTTCTRKSRTRRLLTRSPVLTASSPATRSTTWECTWPSTPGRRSTSAGLVAKRPSGEPRQGPSMRWSTKGSRIGNVPSARKHSTSNVSCRSTLKDISGKRITCAQFVKLLL